MTFTFSWHPFYFFLHGQITSAWNRRLPDQTVDMYLYSRVTGTREAHCRKSGGNSQVSSSSLRAASFCASSFHPSVIPASSIPCASQWQRVCCQQLLISGQYYETGMAHRSQVVVDSTQMMLSEWHWLMLSLLDDLLQSVDCIGRRHSRFRAKVHGSGAAQLETHLAFTTPGKRYFSMAGISGVHERISTALKQDAGIAIVDTFSDCMAPMAQTRWNF